MDVRERHASGGKGPENVICSQREKKQTHDKKAAWQFSWSAECGPGRSRRVRRLCAAAQQAKAEGRRSGWLEGEGVDEFLDAVTASEESAGLRARWGGGTRREPRDREVEIGRPRCGRFKNSSHYYISPKTLNQTRLQQR